MTDELKPGTIVRDKHLKFLKFEVIARGHITSQRIPGYKVKFLTGHEKGRETFAPDGMWEVCK